MPSYLRRLARALRPVPPQDGTCEPAIIARMAEGDAMALGEIYDREAPTVYQAVMRIVRCPDDGEDVVEETFYRAWQRAGSFDVSHGSVCAWLLRMGRSRALDLLRRRSSGRNKAMLMFNDARLSTRAPSAVEQAEASEHAEYVRTALDRIPAREREAIVLALFGGLSHSEIAVHLGIPLGTVKTRIRRGMERLRELLIFTHVS